MKFRLTQLSGGNASTWTGEVAQQRSCRSIQLKYRVVFVPISISRMCLHCWLCNAQVSSLRWPRGQRVLRGEVLGCNFAKYSGLRWRESHNLPVLLCILPSACSWTQSTVTIHSNVDRGLVAVDIGNNGRPWTLKRTHLETWEQKSWVEQRTLRRSSFYPIDLFISTPQVLWLRTTPTLVSYSNRFHASFSFFSISLNHSLSMHSVHFLPNLEFDKSRIVEIWGALITTLHRGTYASFLCSIGT